MRRTSVLPVALLAGGLACAAAAAGVGTSHANGRPPATTNVKFRPGEAESIYLPVTFGLLSSPNNGESFEWVCENAIGYGGTFDPDYAVTAEGDIYATTFEGLRVSRDSGCTWETIGGVLNDSFFFSEVEIGPDGRIWTATSTGGGPNNVYVSTDGSDFVESNLLQEKAWWLTLRTTEADAQRIYVSGFLPQDTMTDPAALLRRSLDGGKTWEELPTTDFAFLEQRRLYLLGVSPTDADLLFARVEAAVEPIGDALYRSIDGGLTWERKLDFADAVSAFHIRPDGMTVIAATVSACPGDPDPTAKGCVKISRDGGANFKPAAQQPRLACLGERSDGLLFGCGANWEPDNFALGRSKDGEKWEKVFRFSETTGPLECPSGSAQAECAALVWPGLCIMFGICSAPDAGPPPAQDAGAPGGGGDDGWCGVGAGGDSGWVPGLVLITLAFALGRRRRRRRAG
jgi:MYXO-CTERM domain-containing protein